MLDKKKSKKGAGGKLIRSEVVQARLSPQLRLMGEIMARQQRRTLSSLIETLIEKAAQTYSIPVMASEKNQTNCYLFGERKYKKLSVKNTVDRIWATEEADRFALFALFLPDLLTATEERVWQLIVECPYFWDHFEINIETRSGKVIDKEKWPMVDYRSLIREHLREHWPLLQAILEDRKPIKTFQQLKLPVGRVLKKPTYYPYPIKKVLSNHD